MHEVSLVEGILEVALRRARSANASRVLSVRIVITDSSPYLEEALATLWDEACAATEAAGARIECVHRPSEWLCLDCLHQCSGGGTGARCPECGSEWMKPISGDDCYVDSIDVDTPRP